MQNYFLLLGLPFDSPDLDEETIQNAIRKKQREWSGECTPIRLPFVRECLEQLPTIKAVMLNKETRAEEARKAFLIKSEKEKNLIEEIDRHIKILSKKYGQYGFSKEEITGAIHRESAAKVNPEIILSEARSTTAQEQEEKILVGIDFGASFIKMAVVGENDDIQIIRDEDGASRFPATVFYDNEGYANVGEAIEYIDFDMLHRTCYMIRNYMLESHVIDGREVTQEAIGFLLKASVGLAEAAWKEEHPSNCNQIISKVVVCYPSWFNASEKTFFVKACEKSGISLAGVLDDASAIAAAYDITTGNEGRSFLIVDIGWSTFFVGRVIIKHNTAVLEQFEHCDIAGRLWTERIMFYLCEQLGLSLDDADLEVLYHLKEKANLAKEDLSKSHVAAVNVDLPKLHKAVPLCREQFESLLEPYLERIVQITQRVAGDVQISQILLAGGESNIPRIREVLETAFGVEVRKFRPEFAVSVGSLVHRKKTNNSK